MNAKRRRSLKRANMHLETAVLIIQDVIEDEQNSLDNIPENLTGGERYETMENYIDIMEDAVDDIDSVMEKISDELL